jgi:DNA-binding SARP family transcriptional activator/TolB-like protein
VIRLRLFGAPRLELPGTAPRRSVLSQPRRLALLAYLALRAPRGPERRDTLLGVFWPESDTNHARGALRNALHFLRVSLGPDVIHSRGSEEVELDGDALWCDAVEFDRLCDAGDAGDPGEDEAALRLYAGELLEGFFISDAPEFEQWLDGERDRLRQRAVTAARRAAAAAVAAGHTELLPARLRRLIELAPTDEAAVRDLMEVLAARGDRGEAVRVFGEFEARLAEYGLDPAPDTVAIAARMRSAAPLPQRPAHPDAPARGSAPAPPSSRAEPRTVSPPAPAAPAPTAVLNAPGRRSRWPPAAVVVAAIAAAALGVAVLMPGRATEPPSSDVVAVMPFEYRGSSDHAYLAEGLADLLAANLNGAGELRAIDPRALLPPLQGATLPIPPAAARREAAAHGAALFVLGSVTEAAGRLRIAAALYTSGTGRTEGSTAVVVEGSADEVLSLVDRLSVGLLQPLGTGAVAQAALRTTSSIDALKAFLHGEAALRRGEVHAAVEHFRTATLTDSTFALAHYRLSSAAYRQGLARIPAVGAAAALAHAHRLVREDSLLVAAWYHHVAGSVTEAHRLYEEALVTRPSHVEAAFQLGELRFHWGSAIGVPASAAHEPFSRVLAAEPRNLEPALHLARLAARDGRTHEIDSLVTLMERAEPGGGWKIEMAALRAFLAGDTAAQRRALAVAAEQPYRDRTILEAMAAFSYELAAVERQARARLHADGVPAQQARMQLFLVHVQLARGRYRDAAATVEGATALPLARRLEYRAMMAALPFLTLPDAEIDGVRAAIAAHPDLPLRDEGGPFADRGVEYPHLLWPGMYRPRRLFLLAALHLRLGDGAAATAVADSLARFDPNEPLAFQYERLTRARVAAAAGQPAAGLRALGPVRPPPLRTFESLVDHARPMERWVRAELLRETGRLAEALRWYGTFPDPIARDLPYLAPSHLRRAQIHDARGEHADAAFHYRRFVELWAAADPELQPEVARARARVGELRPH